MSILLPNELNPPIGCFATTVFEVSNIRVFTYDNYQRTSRARYAKHELINYPPVTEWLGRDLDEISFDMKFSVRLGVLPAAETEKIRAFCREGVADYLIFGCAVIGQCLWTITELTERTKTWDHSGNMLSSTIEVKMQEYVGGVPES